MKKSIWGRIGWFFAAIGMGVLSLVMQLGCGFVLMFIISFLVGMQYGGDGTSMGAMTMIVQERYMESAIIGVAMYHVLGILVFGLWYYFAYGKKKRPANAEKPGVIGILVVCIVGVLLQLLISGILIILMEKFPGAFESYIELMEAAGITETTFLSVFVTVIMAPVGEELLCRGLILRFAEKVSDKFWIANCIQALAFGIIHGNLVQGAYAFFLGLVLGYIYKKYRNIWICMLLHGVINLSSMFVGVIMEILCDRKLALIGIVCVVAAVLLALCFRILGKIKPLEDGEAGAAAMTAEPQAATEL